MRHKKKLIRGCEAVISLESSVFFFYETSMESSMFFVNEIVISGKYRVFFFQ